MADRKPLKVLPDSASGTGGGDSTGIGEFVAGDTLGVIDGGTGLDAVGANQLLTGHNSSTTGALTSESNLTFDGSTLNVVGNAGVGIARTDGTLHVHTATAGSVAPNANEDDLVIENSTHCGITILAPDASDSTLCFGSASDAVGAILRWNHDANLLKLSTANAGDKLTFSTAADVLAMTIDASQNVGIGTAAPSTDLEVMGPAGDFGTLTLSTAETTIVNTDPLGRLDFKAPLEGSGSNAIYPTVRIEARATETFDATHNQTDLLFMLANDGGVTEKMRMLSSGGLTFNGDTAAANALDDYEEGTFTPVLRHSTTSYSASGSQGRYIKIGRFVWFSASITVTNAAVSNSSDGLSVIGLPYTIENTSPSGHARQICTLQYYTGGSTVMSVVSYGVINTTQLTLLKLYNNGTGWGGVPSSEFYQASNNNNAFLTGSYFTT